MVPTLDANFFDVASAWRTRDIVRSEDSSCQAPLSSGQVRRRQHESGAVQLGFVRESPSLYPLPRKRRASGRGNSRSRFAACKCVFKQSLVGQRHFVVCQHLYVSLASATAGLVPAEQ
jgi:hypothetical protein